MFEAVVGGWMIGLGITSIVGMIKSKGMVEYICYKLCCWGAFAIVGLCIYKVVMSLIK